jgi:hypothetical protein
MKRSKEGILSALLELMMAWRIKQVNSYDMI